MGEPLLIGSGNRKKALELAKILEGLPWDVKTLADFPNVREPEEDGKTFEENALIKARYYSARFNVTCVGDDSGLVVDLLGGQPGVMSARYAGPDCNDARNVAKLLDALGDAPWHERTARFVCCVALVRPGCDPHMEQGVVEGHITMEPFGDGGFGYDPVFVPERHEQTFAEMPMAEKHAISHRGRALKKLRAYLESRT